MPRAKVDTRQSLLSTAQRIIAARGYAAVGINEVLAAAGVPKGSFYHYFGSKDAFGEAMLQSYFDDYLRAMDRIVADKSKNAAAHLMSYWEKFYDTQAADDCQGRCLVVKIGAEVADLSEVMRAAAKAGTTAIVDRLDRMIGNGIADGSVSVEQSPRTTAETLYDLWLGASIMAKIHRNRDCLDRAMTVTRQVLHV